MLLKLLSGLVVISLLLAYVNSQKIPQAFDSREQWKNCITPILNQGACGSCWSFSASTSMSARLCIATNGTIPPTTILSPQYLVSCDNDGQSGCHGGDTLAAYSFMIQKGQDTLECTSYKSGASSKEGECPTTCDDESPLADKLYFGTDRYSLVVSDNNDATVQKMQKDLMTHGPLSVSFTVYSSFMTFFKQNPKGIYKPKDNKGKLMGGHAVRLVGWGVENGTKFWTIANSWGTTWAHDGYFRIARGVDLCGIESRRVSAGIPKVGKNVEIAKDINFKLSPMDDKVVLDGAKTKVAVDDEILELARFSLAEMQNKKVDNAPDTFYGVEEAFAQVTNGITYHLKLSVGHGVNDSDMDGVTPPSSMDVVIHRSAHDQLTLKSH